MKKDARRPLQKECDKEIETKSKSYALDFVVAATQILTIICIIKGNPAWIGSLSLLFFGGAACLFITMINLGRKRILRLG